MSDKVLLRGVRSRDPKQGYADRETSLTAAKPEVFKNSLEKAAQLLNDRYTEISREACLMLYSCVAFTVATTFKDAKLMKTRTSPFYDIQERGYKMNQISKSLVENAKTVPAEPVSNVQFLAEPYPYGMEAEDVKKNKPFRDTCDEAVCVMAAWLKDEKTVRTFLGSLLSREGLKAVKAMDLTGTSLRFTMMRPIIAKYMNIGSFEKQRQTNLNAKQAFAAVLETGLEFGIDILGIATGATDSTKVADMVKGILGTTVRLLGGINTSKYTVDPLWNNMRAFLARSQDILRMLAQVSDEILRQQRKNELSLRNRKQQVRERLHRAERNDELKDQLAQLRSDTETVGLTLYKQVLDVSCNITLGYYAIWKLYRSVTGNKTINSKGEDPGNATPGEDALIIEMFEAVADKIQGHKGTRLVKAVGKVLIAKKWYDKVRGAYEAYEQDLRDGIQDVELALSTYRLRVSAENELYAMLREQNPIKLAKTPSNKISVATLPSYEDTLGGLDREPRILPRTPAVRPDRRPPLPPSVYSQ